MEKGLPEIKGKLQAMAVLAEDMVARSVKALLEGDATLAHQVCDDDISSTGWRQKWTSWQCKF